MEGGILIERNSHRLLNAVTIGWPLARGSDNTLPEDGNIDQCFGLVVGIILNFMGVPPLRSDKSSQIIPERLVQTTYMRTSLNHILVVGQLTG